MTRNELIVKLKKIGIDHSINTIMALIDEYSTNNNIKTMDESNETLRFNHETGIYEPTCRLRINTHRAGPGRLQQMYTNLSTGKTYWKDVEIGNFQD